MLQLDEQRALVHSLTNELKKERAKVAAATVAEKGTQTPVNEQASLAHDLRGCEETLENINSCLDKESERFTSFDSWLQVVSDSMNQWKEKQSVDEKVINTLKTEVQELRKLVVQEKASNQENK